MGDNDNHLEGLTPDIYGQVHPEETPEFVSAKMEAFEAGVQAASAEEKKHLAMAEEKCPELLTKDFQLMFLRCEMFRVDPAVKRYCHYWERRASIFGPEKAFQPLTLAAALSDDVDTIRNGFITPLPAKDPKGRAILFADPSLQDHSKFARDSQVRAFWYALHTALESETAQKHGIVVIAWPKRAKFGQFDRKLMKINVGSLKGAIPVRMSAFHLCQPPAFASIILPIVKVFMGERLRKRVNVHPGETKQVHTSLEKYGITPEQLPSELDGKIELNRDSWVDSRLSTNK